MREKVTNVNVSPCTFKLLEVTCRKNEVVYPLGQGEMSSFKVGYCCICLAQLKETTSKSAGDTLRTYH